MSDKHLLSQISNWQGSIAANFKYIHQVRIVATDEGKTQPQAQMEKD